MLKFKFFHVPFLNNFRFGQIYIIAILEFPTKFGLEMDLRCVLDICRSHRHPRGVSISWEFSLDSNGVNWN